MKGIAFITLIAVITCWTGDLTSAQTVSPNPTPPPSAADVSFHAYGDHDLTCMRWTDGCRTCQRSGESLKCSNIGISCQPAAIKCTLRKETAK